MELTMQEAQERMARNGGNLLEKRYGLDSGSLVCTLADGGNGYCYQIDTAVADRSVDYDTFITSWRESHPDRALRTVITLVFATEYAYIIAHHQKA